MLAVPTNHRYSCSQNSNPRRIAQTIGSVAASAPARAPQQVHAFRRHLYSVISANNPTLCLQGALGRRFTALVLFCIVWTVALLSISAAHKEFRFILPLLPLSMPVIAQALHALNDGAVKRGTVRWGTIAAIGVAAIHGVAVVYVSLWHQHGS